VTILLKSNSEKIIEGLERNPGLRLVLGLIPYAPGVLDMFVAHGKNLQEARLVELFRCLDQVGFVITEQLIKDEDFIHNCLVTMRAAARTKRVEKIALLANALINSTSLIYVDDRCEELFGIIDDISLREFRALNMLALHELKFPKGEQNELQRTNPYWQNFLDELHSKLGIEKGVSRDFLKRIERTGCYAEITGTFYDYRGGVGYLTNTYFEIENLCKARSFNPKP
jgi:hypothetical protein